MINALKIASTAAFAFAVYLYSQGHMLTAAYLMLCVIHVDLVILWTRK